MITYSLFYIIEFNSHTLNIYIKIVNITTFCYFVFLAYFVIIYLQSHNKRKRKRKKHLHLPCINIKKNSYKDLYNYVKKRAQIEEEYSKSLFKLHQKSFNTPSTTGGGGTIGASSGVGIMGGMEREKEKEEIEASGSGFTEAWNSIERAAQVEGQAHATYLIIEKIKRKKKRKRRKGRKRKTTRTRRKKRRKNIIKEKGKQ